MFQQLNTFKILILFALSFFVLNSCAPGENKTTVTIPFQIIPPDSMVLILADMQLTESILREYQRTGREDEKRNEKYYHQVFEKYNLTTERYHQSIDFYEQNPELYYSIYTDVLSLLTKMQAEEKAAAEQEK